MVGRSVPHEAAVINEQTAKGLIGPFAPLGREYFKPERVHRVWDEILLDSPVHWLADQWTIRGFFDVQLETREPRREMGPREPSGKVVSLRGRGPSNP